jgi:Domain of unknown function (DUF4625)
MKKIISTGLLLAVILLLSNCSKDKDAPIDTTYPEINITAADAFPKQCSVVKRGEKIVFRAALSDNAELGSLSLDIHHNFDHHTHSTEVESCAPDPVKSPVTPFLFIQSFPIPAGLKVYQPAIEVAIPANVDPGDYHFMIRLTDKEGWQTLKGLSIKII